jgi:hypothetical protein
METPPKRIASFISTWLPVFGGGAGVIALYGFASSFMLLPSRVDRVEEVNKSQNSEIAEIRNDAAQRRELLATALAMITQINDRTKRMEDYLLQTKK